MPLHHWLRHRLNLIPLFNPPCSETPTSSTQKFKKFSKNLILRMTNKLCYKFVPLDSFPSVLSLRLLLQHGRHYVLGFLDQQVLRATCHGRARSSIVLTSSSAISKLRCWRINSLIWSLKSTLPSRTLGEGGWRREGPCGSLSSPKRLPMTNSSDEGEERIRSVGMESDLIGGLPLE